MAIETPCIKVCTVDPATRTCRGCGRSLDEIALWTRLTDAERAWVMAELPDRLARFDARAASEAPAAGRGR